MKRIKLSEKIELIVYIFEQCKADDRWYQEQQKEAESDETNLAHELEGVGVENRCPPKYEQRAIIATKLQNALIKRRIAKDNIRLNQPLFRFIESEVGAKALNQLKQTLGDLRRLENDMADRVYNKREAVTTHKNPTLEKNLNQMIRDWKKKKRNKY